MSGGCLAIGFLIPWAMLPDCIEQDELVTGKRREGLFYSVFVLFQKVSLAAGVALSNYGLGIAGYEAPANDEVNADDTQPDSVLWTLRTVVLLVPAFILATSWVAIWFYPITKSKHEELKQQIMDKKEKIANDKF
eukprot:CAMPEP_0174252842 /NCGR_PEP_ID=MMETSP0439-20130205/2209_1 /TAXON_ID=0 /ORGANISM="Stereomyxa ramosa, Strain Chinc5" /LENGTH=134 /DNA_ID=CAMNT_0015333493 /DNA_START=521 /DNA_END=925 /DNA_ORIENTATION=-